MLRLLMALAALLSALAAPLAAQDAQLPLEERQLVDQLFPRSGIVEIEAAQAKLDLGEKYVFYGPEDSRRILVEAWGNRPEEAEGVLGLVMPAGSTPFSDAWGAVVTYDATGYVSDDDARDADYAALMAQMQENAAAAKMDRRTAGYPAVQVIGWAQFPAYDSVGNSVVWAREIAFEGNEVHSLNYDLRTLGRSGVLSLNLISTMPELHKIKLAANDLAQRASFDEGARYSDFDSSTDEVAGYGIAGLVAGGVGLAVAKKAGFLVVLLKFLQPILLVLFVLLVAFRGRIVALFRRRSGRAEDFETSTSDKVVASLGKAAQVRDCPPA